MAGGKDKCPAKTPCVDAAVKKRHINALEKAVSSPQSKKPLLAKVAALHKVPIWSPPPRPPRVEARRVELSIGQLRPELEPGDTDVLKTLRQSLDFNSAASDVYKTTLDSKDGECFVPAPRELSQLNQAAPALYIVPDIVPHTTVMRATSAVSVFLGNLCRRLLASLTCASVFLQIGQCRSQAQATTKASLHQKAGHDDKRMLAGTEQWRTTHCGFHPTHNSVKFCDDGSGTGRKIDLYREHSSGFLLQQSKDFIFLADE